jgi:hypothetical protein
MVTQDVRLGPRWGQLASQRLGSRQHSTVGVAVAAAPVELGKEHLGLGCPLQILRVRECFASGTELGLPARFGDVERPPELEEKSWSLHVALGHEVDCAAIQDRGCGERIQRERSLTRMPYRPKRPFSELRNGSACPAASSNALT